MRTDDLIAALAADNAAVSRHGPSVALARAFAVGVPIALALTVLWLGLRPDLAAAVGGAFFWIKAAYTAALGVTFGLAVERLARPGLMPRRALAIGAGVVALFVVAGAIQLLTADPDSWMILLRGDSSRVCARNILVLGAPMTVITVLGLRALAPTSPTLAGLAAGVFSGGVAATVYGLHCAEATFVFVGVWYTLGVVLCGGLGAALGRLLLRW